MNRIVVIPAKNEEATIAGSIVQVPYPIIVVDGHSSDRTREVACNSGALVVTSRGRNYGDAVLSGLRQAVEMGAEEVVVMDAESHQFSDIQPYLDGDWHILAGKRTKEDKPGIRRAISRLGRFVSKVMIGSPIADPSNGFRAYKKQVVLDYLKQWEYQDVPSYAFNFALAMSAYKGARIQEFPMSYVGGKTGMTKKELFKAGVWIWRHLI